MTTFFETCLLAVFLVPFVLERRALRGRRLDPAKMPSADRPPVAPGARLPRLGRRRYVEAGVADVVAFLAEQDPAR